MPMLTDINPETMQVKDLEVIATYSPDDNKIRIYPTAEKFSEEIKQKLRANGYIWAPRQKLYVAPKWTPAREDLAIELCGSIGDEDKSLVERAEERAERFAEYSEKRADEAQRKEENVGDQTVVGHHSARRANKEAEKLKQGLVKVAELWETANYWEQRARGAVATAKHKERPEVRYRRIRGLEAELRGIRGRYTPTHDPPKTMMQGDVEYVYCGPGGRGGSWVKVDKLPQIKAAMIRWEQHYENRLRYELLMQDEQGGIVAQQHDLQVGGQIRFEDRWMTILKLNKKDGKVISVNTNGKGYYRLIPIDRIAEYKAPTEELAAKATAAAKAPPLCNYPGGPIKIPRFTSEDELQEVPIRSITKAQWARLRPEYKGTRIVPATATPSRHRVRVMIEARAFVAVHQTDEKEKIPLPPEGPQAPTPADLPRETVVVEHKKWVPSELSVKAQKAQEAAKAGVKTVVADQLFPTPPEIARQMLVKVGSLAGKRILEPSAGTGNLVEAIFEAAGGDAFCRVVAVEVAPQLIQVLRDRRARLPYANDENFRIVQGDFLQQDGALGQFDLVVMNPPFANRRDVIHVDHARRFLKLNEGKLIAIMSPAWTFRNDKITKAFRAYVHSRKHTWELLPAGTFSSVGTEVHTGILTLE
jgi:predicted RNA methylase